MTQLTQPTSRKSTFASRITTMAFVALALIIMQSSPAQAQWTTGTNINNTNTGNVGVGTTSPGYALDVQQNTTNNASGTVLRLKGNVVGTNDNTQIRFTGKTNGDLFAIGSDITSNNGTRAFQLYDLVGAAARVTVDASGNVGIGTSAPAAKLEVSGANVLPRVTNTNAASYGGIELFEGTTIKFGLHTLGSGSGSSFAGEANGLQLWNYANGAMVFGTNASERMRINASGNVGIGTTTPAAKLDVNGNVSVTGNITATGNIAAKYQDVAEWVESSQLLPAGTVVVLDHTKSNQVIASSKAYDTRVAGVISAQPGITLGEAGESKVLVATTGRVKVKVDASAGPIQVGDLLVTSDIEGVAKKSEPLNLGGVQIHRPGTLIGKALEPLAKGTGEILVLLSLQ